ncbi:hypothetical protein C2G38_2160725 [Gigaspora rosea]|uniref:Uncharacterized protein n=1 Tax=Gigaspora rosea TaxID=44941 RepID=A0A397W249_9GLOM|nr:hypothetical protein C2G38_2160725 [Gigaspora rosea]
MCYIKNSSIWLCILTYAVSLRYELDVKIKTKQTGPIYPWTQINQLEECNPFPRYGHSSNEYAINKQVFIFGGVVEGKPQNDVFVIETMESQNLCWKFISPSNYAPPVRAGHIACVYKNNIYIYDTQNNSWSEISSNDFNPFPRCYHKAALVDDIIYVFGGMTNDNKELSDLTAFRIKQLVRPCYGHIMTTADDKVFIFGGESTHSKGIIHILDTSKIKFPTGSYLNAFSQRQLLRRSSEPSISTTSPKFPTRETSSYTNEQNNNITIKNQKSIFRLSQITNLQGFITRPGGPKRRVKSPLEKVTESLPEIEENSTIDENLKISETFTNDEKIIEKEKFSESFDKVPTSNINLEFDGTNSNIGRTRNIKPAFDETQLQRPQDDQTVDQTPILLDNFHDNIPTISKHSNIVRDDDNFSNSSDRPKCYLERLQEQDFQIAEFKKRECWLKTQLELAKKNGYTPDSPDNELNDDIDTEKMSDCEEIGSEKFSIIRFLVQLNQQLLHANTANQSKLASEKIANIESKFEKTTNLLNDIQTIKEQLLQIKRQSEASKQIAVNSERYESEVARQSKEISECYDLETFYEIAEIEDMIRLVESKAAILQQQLKEIKQKANQIGSDYQMIHIGVRGKLQKAVNTHDNVKTSIMQDYINQQSLNQQLKILKKEKLQKISLMQTQITQIQNEKALVDREYEELKRMYSPLKHENDALRKSNELLRQQILTSENMKENLEQEIEQTKSSFEQQEALKEIEEEKWWEEEKELKEHEINLYKEKNNKLIATNDELEQKLINSESKVAMLLDQMESIIEVYRSIGDVFGIPNTEESPTINFKIQEPKTSEIRDDYFDNLVKEKYPDLPSFVLPEYPSSPTDTEFYEIVSFDENDSDIDIGKSSDQSSKLSYFESSDQSSKISYFEKQIYLIKK